MEKIIALLLASEIPDPNEPLPTSNLPATIIGTTISFLVGVTIQLIEQYFG
jgi:hypothetical protein